MLPKGSTSLGFKNKAQHKSLFLKFPFDQLDPGGELACLRDKLERNNYVWGVGGFSKVSGDWI